MKIQHLISALLVFSLLIIALPLQADEKEDAITYRVRVMKGIGSNMGSIGDILKGKVPHKNIMVNYAKSMNESAQTVATIFKLDTSSSKKNTRAKKEIWAKWDDFEKKSNDLIAASANFVTAAESGDMKKIGAAMKELGGTCGSCHKAYRVKK
ncbi:MAG: cytochrome c [SAR324 cluster bacterium]|nr:cytochrome c [SAR324 cluster bacterium]